MWVLDLEQMEFSAKLLRNFRLSNFSWSGRDLWVLKLVKMEFSAKLLQNLRLV